MRFLIVEDNVGDALLFRTLLQRNGPVEVTILSDGEAAIQFFSNPESPIPDAILLDINLPKMNGFEVLQDLRTHAHLEEIPIFVFSGSGNSEDAERCRQLRAASFITKPIGLNQLEEEITGIFEETKKRQSRCI